MRPFAAAALCAAVLLPASAGAQSAEPWQFGLSVYGWFPSLKGSTTFPAPPGGGSDVSVDAKDILDNLQGVLMGTFEARRGRWGGFTDLVYMNLGNTQSQTRDLVLGGGSLPAGVTADLRYDLKGTAWTLAGEYRALAGPDLELDAFAGARMIDIDQRIDFSLAGSIGALPLPDHAGTRRATLKNWDAIVGLKGRFHFGAQRSWFVPYYADIGAGDSDLTVQLMTGVGRSFQWGELVAQWRYLDYDFSGRIESLSFNGPLVAVNFRW